MNIQARQKRQVLKKQKALAKRDAEQAEGKEVPDEDEEVEVADVTEAQATLRVTNKNE